MATGSLLKAKRPGLWPGLPSCLSRTRRQCELCVWNPGTSARHVPAPPPPRMPAISLPTTSAVQRRTVSPRPRQLWPVSSPLSRCGPRHLSDDRNLAAVCLPPQCPSYQRQRGPPRGERGLAAKGAWRGRNGRRCPSALAAPPRQPPASPHRTVLATAAPPPGLSPRTCRHARHGQARGQAPRSALPPQSQLGCTNRTSFPAGTATDGGRHLACGRLLHASFQQSASSSSAGCLCFCSLLSSQHLTQSLAH